MKGYMVPRKAGWDTHGLPVELEVRKAGTGRQGADRAVRSGAVYQDCKESVWKYKGMWEDFSNTVGFWADMDNPYVTYDNDLSSPSGGLLSRSGTRVFCTRALRWFPTARAAEPRCPAMRWPRAIRM